MSDPTPDGGALVCPVHPDRAAVAACLACGRWLCAECRLTDEQGMPICAACAAERAVESAPGPAWAGSEGSTDEAAAGGDEEPPAPDEPGGAVAAPGPIAHPDAVEVTGEAPIAWEHPDRFGDFVAFGRTVFEAFTGPIRFMGRIPWVRRDYRTPLVFALVCMLLGYLGVVMAVAADPSIVVLPEPRPGMPRLPDLPPAVVFLIGLPTTPLLFTVMLFFEAGLAHLLVRLAGAARRPFEATFRVFAYAQVACLLLLVPGPGQLLENFLLVFLVLTGMRLAHQTRFLAGLLALVPVMLQQMLLT
ncbi:MAG: hypothetical protein H6704_28910 [Myxococcales bacterium]|nr:hypothetical protein [Myxococcales bacterium]